MDDTFNHFDSWALALVDRALGAGHLSTDLVQQIQAALDAAERASRHRFSAPGSSG
jgi:hypothetical protein